MTSIDNLLDSALAGDRPSLARLLSLAERGGEAQLAIESRISSLTGNAYVVGITGAPGAGKSTLINALLPLAVESTGRAAVVAVDPSSPFSQGALLGDRVRMQGRSTSSNVFIRSMASRGEFGGLARAASTSVRLFDACGWPLVIIETLGIGQVELDIMDLADTVVVVLNPGWGDTIQANKAGLTEAGDVFIINKADKPGVEQTRKDLVESLSLLHRDTTPPVCETIATSGEGLPDAWGTLQTERELLSTDPVRQEKRRHRRQRIVAKTLRRHLDERLDRLMESEFGSQLTEGASLGEIDLDVTLDKLFAELSRIS